MNILLHEHMEWVISMCKLVNKRQILLTWQTLSCLISYIIELRCLMCSMCWARELNISEYSSLYGILDLYPLKLLLHIGGFCRRSAAVQKLWMNAVEHHKAQTEPWGECRRAPLGASSGGGRTEILKYSKLPPSSAGEISVRHGARLSVVNCIQL